MTAVPECQSSDHLDTWRDRIREEGLRLREAITLPPPLRRSSGGLGSSDLVEHLLATASAANAPLQGLPRVLNRFPFAHVPFLRRMVLRAFELLFRRQNLINSTLLAALAELHSENQRLRRALEQIGQQGRQFPRAAVPGDGVDER